ncbi:MAG TPA: hypothetical protein VKG01_15155 [Thermoanaerobaculia bacterium]|nr:hypothetical protein [Thermoanaerobaculia bacterium]
MAPLDEKPFRSSEEPAEISVHMGQPQVRPHVVPIAGKSGPLTKSDFVTSFLVAWQPIPTPPAHWVELLRSAPFGTQSVRARDLHWNGRSFSIELPTESEVEAFIVEMPDWVAFANAEFGRREHTPAEEALAEAENRARQLEARLRR